MSIKFHLFSPLKSIGFTPLVLSLCPSSVSGKTSFAQEALAGLASKENFSKVALKKADSFKGVKYAPYNDVMLLHVKGTY